MTPFQFMILNVRQDSGVAKSLKAGLQSRGASVQLDHEVLEEGKVWVDSLKTALEAVDLILILVSPDFLYSQSANFGAGMAISLQSP